MWVLLFAVASLGGDLSRAEVPPLLINYQREFADLETGDPKSGTYTITFSLCDTATGGAALWKETQRVTVANGQLHVLLGSTVPLSGFPGGTTVLFSKARWLGVKIDKEKEIIPRQQILSGMMKDPAEEEVRLSQKDIHPCPDDMVDLGHYCIDRNQITTGLTWYAAADYCHAGGRRLCRISEWMEACDGSPINGVEDMPGRQSQWVDNWVYETSTKAFDAVQRGFFRCSSISHPWSQYRPLENKWFRCCL